ncbi:MAG: hypothetical protein R3B09_01150 [Nannocystaceae bacterium]
MLATPERSALCTTTRVDPPARVPLCFRQARLDARGLQTLTLAIGDGRVRVHAVDGAEHVAVKATAICEDLDAVDGDLPDLRPRLCLAIDRASDDAARLLVVIDDAPAWATLDVVVVVPPAVSVAVDHDAAL